VNTHRIAEFDESDDALRFCHMKGADFVVCGGIERMWAVRPKSQRELDEPGFNEDREGDEE
jgi:hypothetical protein